MDWVVGFIAGVCIMSLFALFAVVAADEGNETLMIILCGPVGWLWVGVLKIIRCIKLTVKHSRFKALLICPDGQVRYINSNKAQTLVDCEEYEYRFVRFVDLNTKATEWPKEYQTTLGKDTVGNVRYCPKSVWKKYEEISKEDYKLARTN